MKRIGLLGGMSWESTVSYYQTINRVVGERLGGLHSAEILLYSVDFHDVEQLQHAGRWSESGELLSNAALALQSAGAEFLVLCTNTMHKVAPQLEASVSIPLLHIADATAESISSSGLERVGLLGTRFTMEEEFYRGRLQDRHGLKVIVPPEQERESVHRIIYDELCRGRILPSSRAEYLRVVSDLVAGGCEGVILGCTEIGLLLRPSDASVPLFDTAEIHAEKAALYALGESPPSRGQGVMIPGPRDYLSFLMAAPDISDDELGSLGIEIVDSFGSGTRGLRVPGDRLLEYKALVRDRLRPGFWNELVGREEMFFMFKLRDGTLRELRYSAETRDEIARLCSELNEDPIERTSDMPRYLAGNPFYRELAIRFHGAPGS